MWCYFLQLLKWYNVGEDIFYEGGGVGTMKGVHSFNGKVKSAFWKYNM